MNREYLNFAQNQPNVMSDEKTLTVDLEKVIRDKNPALARLLPRFVVAYLKRTIHQDEINRILQAYSHLEPIPFIRAALADMGIRYRAVGLEKLPREGRYLFASNHPFGGMDGMMLCDELERHFGSVKIIVNDLLMHLTPLNPLFIPVNKHGRQKAQYAELLRENLQSDVDVRLECGPEVDYADLLDIQEQLEARLGRSVEIITNPLEFMRPAFRHRIQQDEVLLYEAA